MENAGKALEIAAGVMLGVMLMALIVYFFKTVGEWPQQEADMMTVEQLAKFNAEFEVYDKSGMYGVDVISCLNKAINNDDKYILEENEAKLGFLTEGRHPKDYCVNVFVQLKDNKLEESVEVTRIDNNGKQHKYSTGEGPNSPTVLMSEAFGSAIGSKKIKSKLIEGNLINKSEYILVTGEKTADGKYFKLLTDTGDSKRAYKYVGAGDSNSISLYEITTSSGDNLSISVKNTKGDLTNWNTAIWYTALYDLKKRRFKCDKIEYYENSKRVSGIYFSEL